MDDSPVLFELVRAPEASSAEAQERYERERSRALLDAGVAKASQLYVLRLQKAPASPLGETVLAGIHLLSELGEAPSLPKLSGLERIGSASYHPIAHCGERLDPHAAGPPTSMIVLSHPTDLGHDEAYNRWYSEEHMPDVALSPGFRGAATRYRPVGQQGPTPLSYLCVYEIEVPYSASLDADLERWQIHTELPSRVPMPLTPAGEVVLTLDLWGYFSRIG